MKVDILSYLVASRTRQTLLRLLWERGDSGTVSELAKLGGLSVSNVYEELQEMEKAGLATSHVDGSSPVYAANLRNPAAEAFKTLLNSSHEDNRKVMAGPDFNEDNVLANLERVGAPLGGSGRTLENELSLEETLADALKLSHINATVARVLPVVFSKNKNRLDHERLRLLAKRRQETRTLGFFLDLTSELGGNREFKEWAAELFDHRVKKDRDFFSAPSGRYGRQLAERNTPWVAKKWHYRMNMEFDTFKTLFEKFA